MKSEPSIGQATGVPGTFARSMTLRLSFAAALASALAQAACSSSSGQSTPSACDGGECGTEGLDGSLAGDGPSADQSSSANDSSATPEAAPGGPEAGADAGRALTVAFLNSSLCLSASLPASPDGGTTCGILLIGVKAGCAQPGLSPATAEEIALVASTLSVHDYDAATFGNVCEVAQLPPSPTAGTDCASAASGWCYVPRACKVDPGQCAQALCTTAAFDTVAGPQLSGYGTAFLDCR
jgi:hypothetical protein